MRRAADISALSSGVEKVVDLVQQDGTHPNDAMAKVAKELDYAPGYLKLACNAYNTGRQLSQWQSGSQVLDKLASFDTVDFDVVKDKLWPTTKEASSVLSGSNLNRTNSDIFDLPPIPTYAETRKKAYEYPEAEEAFQKLASSVTQAETPDHVQRRWAEKEAKVEIAKLEKQVRDLEVDKVANENEFNYYNHLIHQYFRQDPYSREPFPIVKKAAVRFCGKWAGELLDCVSLSNNPVDSGSVKVSAVKESSKIFGWVEKALSFAVKRANTEIKLAELKSKLSDLECKKKETDVLSVAGEKRSGIWAGMAGGSLSQALGYAGKSLRGSAKDITNKYEEAITDPHHLNDLRRIRAQTALMEILSDPDNPISGQPQSKVIREFNQIASVAPSILDKPALLEPVLRRRLVGMSEPFESQELLKLESSARSLAPDTISSTHSKENEGEKGN